MANAIHEVAAIAREGDIVFIECTEPMSISAFRNLEVEISEAAKRLGIKMIALAPGLRVAKVQKEEVNG